MRESIPGHELLPSSSLLTLTTLERTDDGWTALCLGAVLAYPVRWRMRCAAALGGVALIVALNTIRIGTLGLVVASPAWFTLIHLYLWPTILTLGIAAYVFVWMRIAAEDLRYGPGASFESVAGLSAPRHFPLHPQPRDEHLVPGVALEIGGRRLRLGNVAEYDVLTVVSGAEHLNSRVGG